MSNDDITVTMDKGGEVSDVRPDQLGSLRHTLDDPNSPVARLHAGRKKRTDIDPNQKPARPRLGMEQVQTSYLASVALPSEQLIGSGQDSIQITSDQMARITRKHEIDAYAKGSLSILTPEKTGLQNRDHLRNIEHAVHAVMHELLTGMDVLRIPPADVFHLLDTLRDHAFAYASHCASSGNTPCLDTLKNTMRQHKDVQHFQRRHNPGTSFGLEDAYCSKTGKPRHHICTSSVSHHGHLDDEKSIHHGLQERH